VREKQGPLTPASPARGRKEVLLKVTRLLLIARLRSGSAERARQLIDEAPRRRETEGSLDRVGVFLAEDEVVFFFEGEDAEGAVRSFLDDPVRSTLIGPWLPLFAGPLHAAPSAYFWERDE